MTFLTKCKEFHKDNYYHDLYIPVESLIFYDTIAFIKSEKYIINDYVLNQVLDSIKMPKRYYKRLPLWLKILNIHESLKESCYPDPIVVRTHFNLIRAIFINKTPRLSDIDIATIIAKSKIQKNSVIEYQKFNDISFINIVPNDNKVTLFYKDEKRLYRKSILILNSEIGKKDLSINLCLKDSDGLELIIPMVSMPSKTKDVTAWLNNELIDILYKSQVMFEIFQAEYVHARRLNVIDFTDYLNAAKDLRNTQPLISIQLIECAYKIFKNTWNNNKFLIKIK